jgi:hypothetical protein
MLAYKQNGNISNNLKFSLVESINVFLLYPKHFLL